MFYWRSQIFSNIYVFLFILHLQNHSEINHPSVRDLFSELLMANVPVVFHNAIVDLIFLHQNLYCDLPFKLNSFLCNLSEMFTAGIYDTKFLIEYYMRMPASYLEYVFKKWSVSFLSYWGNVYVFSSFTFLICKQKLFLFFSIWLFLLTQVERIPFKLLSLLWSLCRLFVISQMYFCT